MRKNFKRTLAVLCAAALTTLSVAVAGNLSSLKTAAEVSPSGEINFGGDNAYLKLKNPLDPALTSVGAEVNMPSTIKDEWVLRAGGDLTNIIGGMKVDNGLVTRGTTSRGEASGEGMKYIQFTSENKTLTASTNYLGIDVSRYAESDLTLAFWAYSAIDGTLFDSGRLFLADEDVGTDDKPHARYFATNIPVKAGWNYIEIPLSDFEMVNGYRFTDGINYFRIHGCQNTSDYHMQRIGEVKLIVNKDREWTLRKGGISTTTNYDGGIGPQPEKNNITEYSLDKDYDPCMGLKFEEFTAYGQNSLGNNNTFTNSGDFVNIEVSDYDPSELAVDFWLHSDTETTQLFTNGGLIINNRTSGVTSSEVGPFAQYAGRNISVKQGWNHITISLDKFTSVNKTVDGIPTDEEYDWSQNIKVFRFNGLRNANQAIKVRIGEVKLVAKTENKVYTSAVDETVYNKGYSILSNLNSETNDTPYALFVTREGNPAFIYNDKMFVLNHNVCTGEFVKLGVTVNEDGTVTFNVGDDITATSKGTATVPETAVFTATHSIGADANGGTLMNGSIKNLVVKNGETETGRWELFANKAYPLNAVKDSVGLNHAYFAGIENINAPVVVEYATATAGTAPAADMDGYVFAGWFTDAECTQALTGTGKAYAKFVDKAVLTVKAQVKTDAATADRTDMRFVTTVDSANYAAVGFKIEVKNNPKEFNLKNVYQQLLAIGDNGTKLELSPTDISSVSQYFAAYTVKNIPKANYDTEFKVTAYWITLDGTRVYADEFVKTVSQGISK